ncbi:MAG: radical SAM protein [candidate division WOR-3 bacterium]
MLELNNILMVSNDVDIIKTNKGAIVIYKDKIISISQTEALFLALCNGTNSVKEIVNFFSHIYNVPVDIIIQDIKNFFEKFTKWFVILPERLNRPCSKIKNFEEYIFKPYNKDILKKVEGIHTVGIVLNYGCSFGCKYCFAMDSKEPQKYEFINFEDIKKFLIGAKNLGASHLQIGGGDPYKYPQLKDVLDLAIQKLEFKRAEISFKVNDILEKNFFKELKKAGLRVIQFSIDSIDPQKLREITGSKNIWGASLISIYNALETGLEVAIRPTIIKDNVDEILEMCSFFDNLGVQYLRAVQVIPIGRANYSLIPSREKLKLLEEKIKEIQNSFKNIKISILTYKIGRTAACEGGRISAFLYPDGSVAPCDTIGTIKDKWSYNFGNIRESSLEEIWFSKNIEKFRKIRYPNEICESCDEYEACLGGCRVMSHSVLGNPELPDPLCSKIYEHEEKEGEIFTSWKIKKSKLKM